MIRGITTKVEQGHHTLIMMTLYYPHTHLKLCNLFTQYRLWHWILHTHTHFKSVDTVQNNDKQKQQKKELWLVTLSSDYVTQSVFKHFCYIAGKGKREEKIEQREKWDRRTIKVQHVHYWRSTFLMGYIQINS